MAVRAGRPDRRLHGEDVGRRAEEAARQSRPTTYLLSQVDTLPLGGFDSSCRAMAQGATRRARGEAYVKFVNEHLGAHHDVTIIEECGHNNRCVYTDDAALPISFRSANSLQPRRASGIPSRGGRSEQSEYRAAARGMPLAVGRFPPRLSSRGRFEEHVIESAQAAGSGPCPRRVVRDAGDRHTTAEAGLGPSLVPVVGSSGGGVLVTTDHACATTADRWPGD